MSVKSWCFFMSSLKKLKKCSKIICLIYQEDPIIAIYQRIKQKIKKIAYFTYVIKAGMKFSYL